MLGMPALVLGIHVLTVAVLALGLSGLSVGLGAWMPNFRETRPFQDRRRFRRHAQPGGRSVVPDRGDRPDGRPLALLGPQGEDVGSDVGSAPSGSQPGCCSASPSASLAVVVPLRIGIRTLRRMEF